MERELFALLMRVLVTLPGARTRPLKCTFMRSQVLADRRHRKAKEVGNHWHSAHRLRAIEMMKNDPGALRGRRFVESCFGTQGNVTGCIGPLPNYLRGLERVLRWVALKLAIDAAH